MRRRFAPRIPPALPAFSPAGGWVRFPDKSVPYGSHPAAWFCRWSAHLPDPRKWLQEPGCPVFPSDNTPPGLNKVPAPLALSGHTPPAAWSRTGHTFPQRAAAEYSDSQPSATGTPSHRPAHSQNRFPDCLRQHFLNCFLDGLPVRPARSQMLS